MIFRKKTETAAETMPAPKYPGKPDALDGSTIVVEMETAASEAAGAYPITPSTQMGEGWALAVAGGKRNVNGRRLLFFEPEGEHAAAAVTAGMSMTGLRATNFSSGQGIVYMHESLYPAVGKRLTYVLNVAARAITKHSLNVHAGHDDYHAVDDAGFFQVFGKDVQEVGDLTLIAHRIAELSLNPGICAQDGFLTSHMIESALVAEPELIREYLGDPADLIDSPTPAQRLVFGERRRRIPELYDVDHPAMLGTVQNQESYAQGVAAQRPFYFDHVAELADQAMREFGELTGRWYARATGYRLEDAEYVIAGQGSLVANAEAVADHLRERGIKVGVLNLTMFRPFPADLVSRLLCGKKGVAVIERTDQPLAVDPPLLRELRAALSQAVENHRAGNGEKPFPRLASVAPEQVPDFYSGGFGFGSRDLQPNDLIAAVENMLPGGRRQRQFYLGIDFVRQGTRLPKLQIWQEQLLEAYPHLETLALAPAPAVNLLPPGAIALRMHSVGGWGAITTGKNLVMTAFELAGLQVKANPKYGSEKKGQPTTFYAVLSHQRYRLTAELKNVNVVLSPDPNVFRHSNPLAGMEQGGTFVMQSDMAPDELWRSLPEWARTTIREKQIRFYLLDGFAIAGEEASDAELRYRMQGAAFMGAFFRTSPLMEREGLEEKQVFDGIRAQLEHKFAKLGPRVVEDNLRVIRRGFDEVVAVPTDEAVDLGESTASSVARIPELLDVPGAEDGITNGGRFYEQVCSLYGAGQDVLADPFTAISAMPAASSSFRDMTGIRFEVPSFNFEKCTGCSQCWTQCPDSAIPGLVNTVEDTIDTAIQAAAAKGSVATFKSVWKPVAKEVRKQLDAGEYTGFGKVFASAYAAVAEKLNFDAEKRATLDREFAAVHAEVADFPFALTTPFYKVPESRKKGSGGLLSITINPEACKGCNVCVAVCPEHALVTIRQDEQVVEQLRRNWDFWQKLPDTDDSFINVSSIEEGIGVLPSLLLKKKTYRSMVGGDGACMGCGEKTVVHLVVGAIHAMMQPRVAKVVARIDELIETLDAKARKLLAADADLDIAAFAATPTVDIPVAEPQREEIKRLARTIRDLKDLRWRYVEGPSGRGRSLMGMTNSTGCSSVWASTYPFNPYPFPWTNHLFQDAPSVAIGVFEGHMRKMADNFVTLRRAELIAQGSYDAARDEEFFASFDWRQFTDEEFGLCPPIMAMGGDGAMMDIGFQNLSRLMASGKPIRVMVLDTQVYSNTGGQACTSGFTGQVADMSAYGPAQHGKTEIRKELGLIALAHRGTFVLQSSQASASHLLGGVLRGLQSRRPAVFAIYTPCPVEHGLADDWAPNAARLALESRAFPFLLFDPDAGESLADCLSLDGNPALDELWPSYTLKYVDEDGLEQSMELPLTTADWAATEARFKKHFKKVPAEKWNEDMVVFHEYMQLCAEEREGKQPFIWALGPDRRLIRLSVSPEMVQLTTDRLLYWSQLREIAGLKVPESVQSALTSELEARYESQLAALQAEYEARLQQLRESYPAVVARRMAEGLLRATAGGRMTVAELLGKAESTPGLKPIGAEVLGAVGPATGAAVTAPVPQAAVSPETSAAAPVATPAPAAVAVAEPAAEEDDGLALEAYIESDRCTSCNECINLNGKMFGYNENKQATIKDVKAGTFAQLVTAAERCPAGLIHPGTPLNPKEKDLEKWLKRAEKFN